MSNTEASITPEGENPVDCEGPTSKWKDIDWDKAEKHVRRLQTRISKAYSKGEMNLARRLQHLLTKSFYAKAIAVRRVSQNNQGRRTPGVDGVLWLTDNKRMSATLSLNVGCYKAKPTRRIYIFLRRTARIVHYRYRQCTTGQCKRFMRLHWTRYRKRQRILTRMGSESEGPAKMPESNCSI